jgi:gp16 family phage-associated protein
MTEAERIAEEALRHARRRLYIAGKTMKQWAHENSCDVALVYLVLGGRSRARCGKSHDIAVKLGLKSPEDAAKSGEPVVQMEGDPTK